MVTAGARKQWIACALGALLAAQCAAGWGGEADEPDHCIVSNNAIGCLSESALADIVDYNGNLKGLRSAIAEKLGSGLCELFEYGERVYVTDTEGSGRSAVRRPDEPESFWMPASWSRPANECAANASPESVGKKIGMPTPEPAWPRTARPQVFASGTAPPEPVARRCVYKSVMTDAEIRACRRVSRQPVTSWPKR